MKNDVGSLVTIALTLSITRSGFTVLILPIPDYRMTSGSPLCLLSCVYVWGICLWYMHVYAHIWNLEEGHEEYFSPYFPEKGLFLNPEPGWWPSASVLHLLPPIAGLAGCAWLFPWWLRIRTEVLKSALQVLTILPDPLSLNPHSSFHYLLLFFLV